MAKIFALLGGVCIVTAILVIRSMPRDPEPLAVGCSYDLLDGPTISGPACETTESSPAKLDKMRRLEYMIPLFLQQFGVCDSSLDAKPVGKAIKGHFRDDTTVEPGAFADFFWYDYHMLEPEPAYRAGVRGVVVCMMDRIQLCKMSAYSDLIFVGYHSDNPEKDPVVVVPVPVWVPAPKAPLRRDLLAFFAGNVYFEDVDPTRKILFNHYKDNNYNIVVHNGHMDAYYDTMNRARFCLCPPGWAPWSPRIYEAIASGCLPVLFKPVMLPFTSKVDWSFLVWIKDPTQTHRVLQSMSSREYNHRRRLMQKQAHDLLWNLCPRQVLENVLDEIRVHK